MTMHCFLGSHLAQRAANLPLFALLAAVVLTGAMGTARARAEEKPNAEKRNKKDVELADAEHEFVKAINMARRKKDLAPLRANAALVTACREFAGEMAKRGELADAFDGLNAGDRIRNAGVTANHWGITCGKGTSPKEVVKSWAASPIADANILEPHVNQLGIDIAVDGGGENYIAVFYAEVPK